MPPSKAVFIVDDAALMRLTISNLLQIEGRFEIIGSASNGEVALALLKDLKPDIIMLDIEMPVMDGLEYLRHARLKTRAKIVVSSSVAAAGSEHAQRARTLGADAVIQQPSGSISTDLAKKSGRQIIDALKRLTMCGRTPRLGDGASTPSVAHRHPFRRPSQPSLAWRSRHVS